MNAVEAVKVVILGIIQGITEWLPVSSTGHMLLFDALLPLNLSEDFVSVFMVVVQLGSILAVVVLYFNRLWPLKISSISPLAGSCTENSRSRPERLMTVSQ